ncbi:MAG: 50S ribosomal protein L11 methyltransferase [Bacteroidetes bacterium]|nr:50S ribosomal protein L11 methyltransferase [Bacteroidota bacterium]
MSQVYIEIDCQVTPVAPWADLLIAALGEIGFESFENTDSGFMAYVARADYDSQTTAQVMATYKEHCVVNFSTKEIAATNWNADWEKNFSPITVGERIHVRAPFHAATDAEYEIVIEPKMSFGTGHHQTTHLMLEHLLELEINDQDVLDMGSGTAVLAIMACKRGARKSTAIDIDAWCGENGLENAQRNGIENIEVLVGTAEQLPKTPVYDLIIANINRNVLLEDIPAYVACLRGGGVVLLSGFYEADLDIITQRCHECGLVYQHHKTKDNWVAAKFLFL